jgi:hypothetical protein
MSSATINRNRDQYIDEPTHWHPAYKPSIVKDMHRDVWQHGVPSNQPLSSVTKREFPSLNEFGVFAVNTSESDHVLKSFRSILLRAQDSF